MDNNVTSSFFKTVSIAKPLVAVLLHALDHRLYTVDPAESTVMAGNLSEVIRYNIYVGSFQSSF
jgi:hypothetical protein